jgi:hypothetical protein
MVVVEAFHRDATKAGPIGSGVVFDTNELLRLFAARRVVAQPGAIIPPVLELPQATWLQSAEKDLFELGKPRICT